VRGVTFQPIQHAGRSENFDPARDRLTLAEVRQQILKQSKIFQPRDVVPVPCHPDCLAMAYALKMDNCVTPLTGMVDPQLLLHGEGNTIMYEQNKPLRELLFKLFSTGASPAGSATSLRQLLCCLPLIDAPAHVTYDNIFRIIIMQFLDPHNFDVRSVKKTCVHIVHPDGRVIPFDTYNLFYRDERERRLEQIRSNTLTPLTVRGAVTV
jgi:uncharacterized radical SAM superfamily Fe-S cluster-containing enzyme